MISTFVAPGRAPQWQANARAEVESPAQIGPPSAVGIAYLLSQYPAISHTFFLHEVCGLRARGLKIETASINPPDRSLEQLPLLEAHEARSTYYVKSGGGRTLLRAMLSALRHPRVAMRGLAAVSSLKGLTLRKRAYWLFYLAEALLVGRWMKERSLDHLHVHFGGPVASVGMLVSKAWRVPFSLTIHGPEELLNHEAYQLREKLAEARFVICISDFCRSQLCQLSPPQSWHKFDVVRLGVDPTELTPSARLTLNVDGKIAGSINKPIEIVCTGRLVPAKGHSILLSALAELRRQGLDFRATLIGSGPERASLEAFVESAGLAEQVSFTSALPHDATLEHLRRADLFVLASFAEGIPVALMEAMSLGIPCISTTIAGIPELIRNELDGLLVAPGNVSALADAIKTLMRDDYLRHRLGTSARQRIIAEYNLPINQEVLAKTLLKRIHITRQSLPAAQNGSDRT